MYLTKLKEYEQANEDNSEPEFWTSGTFRSEMSVYTVDMAAAG